MKVLVTGSSGFIGGHLTEALLEQEHDVYVLLRQSSKNSLSSRLPVTPVYGDYADVSSLRSCVSEIDIIFHLAAVLNAPDWLTYYHANTVGTQNLLQACSDVNPGLKRFVFVSSIAAAGPVRNKMFRDETYPSRPDSFYGKSKLLAEKLVLDYKDTLPVTIARPPNVIGIRQQELLMILKLLQKRIYPLLGNGDAQTSLCFVQDLVDALILMSIREEACSQTYYITDNKGYSWRNMLEFIARLLGVYPLVVRIPHPILLTAARISETAAALFQQEPLISSRYIISTRYHYHLYRSEKIQKELGFSAKTSFKSGIMEIIHWYEKKGILRRR